MNTHHMAMRSGARMGDVTLFDSMLLDGLHDAISGQHAGWHTEDLVAQFAITREDQDRWAARSQQRFSAAPRRIVETLRTDLGR